jgi:hypothetical protein
MLLFTRTPPFLWRRQLALEHVSSLKNPAGVGQLFFCRLVQLPDESFLHHGHDKLALVSKDLPAGKAPGTRRGR